MGLFDLSKELPRKTQVTFFLIDTSGSMAGESIGQVNDAIREVLPDLKEIAQTTAVARMKIAVLSFSNGTEWITSEPVEVENYNWKDLTAGGGCSDLGEACRELNTKLSKDTFLNDPIGIYSPVIILITKGAPTDDFLGGLNVLKQNKWFNKRSIKVALGVEDADMTVLKEFTGNTETVLYLKDVHMIKRLFRELKVNPIIEEEPLEKIEKYFEEIDAEENLDEDW